jgi:hypothetical protein
LLVVFNNNPTAVAVYGAFVMLVLVLCSLGLRETHKLSTAEINDD